MAGYVLQKNPFIVPTEDGKLIEEFFGKASINKGDYSLAHMIAPPGWGEPFQKPEFDEITYVISGRKSVEIGSVVIVLGKGESIFVEKETRVRYSNPFDQPVEYISFCIPAFTPEKANRESS